MRPQPRNAGGHQTCRGSPVPAAWGGAPALHLGPPICAHPCPSRASLSGTWVADSLLWGEGLGWALEFSSKEPATPPLPAVLCHHQPCHPRENPLIHPDSPPPVLTPAEERLAWLYLASNGSCLGGCEIGGAGGSGGYRVGAVPPLAPLGVPQPPERGPRSTGARHLQLWTRLWVGRPGNEPPPWLS